MINRGVDLSYKLRADVGGKGKGRGVYFYNGVKDTKIELIEGLRRGCGSRLIE